MSDLFQKVRQGSLVEDAVAQIERAIMERSLGPGDKLPSSRELMEIMGTSLGTIREALRILAQKGLVEVRVGVKGGVFVKEASITPITEGLDILIRQRRISLSDLGQFRQVVESGLLLRVAERVGPAEVAEFRDYLGQLEACAAQGADGWLEFLAVEADLRKALIRISDSRMYEAVLYPIHQNLFAYAYRYLPGEEANIQEALEDWRQILRALALKDGETAAAASRAHIARYTRRMEAGRLQMGE